MVCQGGAATVYADKNGQYSSEGVSNYIVDAGDAFEFMQKHADASDTIKEFSERIIEG